MAMRTAFHQQAVLSISPAHLARSIDRPNRFLRIGATFAWRFGRRGGVSLEAQEPVQIATSKGMFVNYLAMHEFRYPAE